MAPDDFEARIRKDREETYQGQGLTMLLFCIIVFLPISVYILHRPLLHTLRYSFGISAAILIPFLIISFIEPSMRWKKGSSFRQKLIHHQSAILQIIAAGIAYYTIGAGLLDYYHYLRSPQSGHIPQVLITVCITLGMGSALFIMRSKWRLFYGLTEILVGVIVASYRVIDAETQEYLHTEFYLAILTAGVYLVVRGMDNVHHAIKKSNEFNLKKLGDKSIGN